MNEMRFFVDSAGVYLGGWDNFEPADSIEVPTAPNQADQVWLFPGWSESPSLLAGIEAEWRAEQMPAALETVTAFQMGEEGIPGTEQLWKDYWVALRKWTNTNPDFPDSSKRPVAPN